MASRNGFELRRHDGRRISHHKSGTDPGSTQSNDGRSQRRSGFAGTEHTQVAFRKRTRNTKSLLEQTGHGRTIKAAADDAQEIVAKRCRRCRQWDCLGSDQDERPVTTSNCLRSELTS
jgi:hypothetical protein